MTHSCTTCYIDYVNGNDSWDGTSKIFTSGTTGPWKHAPGMNGTGDNCTGQCATQVPIGGDNYILKGGVVVPYTVLNWLWNWGGTSSVQSTYGCTGTGCIYVGVDTTWNLGTVLAVTSTFDSCGWTVAPTVTISGGGGVNATATAVLVSSPYGGGSNSLVHGSCIGYYTITNPGSGYTSNP